MSESTNDLRIVHYPDPCLRKVCEPVTAFDGRLADLVARMMELMRTGEGVGLAAPQVGVTLRLFVANSTGRPEDGQVFINPEIREQHGSIEGEEGCLSLPGIRVQVRRAQSCRVRAQDLEGHTFELSLEDLPARIFQHEYDHLNGVMIIDRMGPGDRIATRRTLRALEQQFHSDHKLVRKR